MMTRKKQILFTAIFVFCLAALFLVVRPVKAQSKTIEIVALSRDVNAASLLTAADLELVSVPDVLFNEKYFLRIEDALGQWSKSNLYSGEWLHVEKIIAKPEGLEYAPINNNKDVRLITLALPADAVNGYWLAAGNRVDIDIISRDKAQNSPVNSLENIEVAAVLSSEGSTDNVSHDLSREISSPMVCLFVSREQARILSEAAVRSDIRLSVICR